LELPQCRAFSSQLSSWVLLWVHGSQRQIVWEVAMAITTSKDMTSHAQREVTQWTPRLWELTDQIAPRFARQQARVHANAYQRWLPIPVHRKACGIRATLATVVRSTEHEQL
jgi:hypothetical protein